MKRALLILLVMILTVSGVYAVAEGNLDSSLSSTAMEAMQMLADESYAGLALTIPFSGVAPSVSEWQSIASNVGVIGSDNKFVVETRYVDNHWEIAVAAKRTPDSEMMALVLLSDDGTMVSGYRIENWNTFCAK